MEGTLNRPFLGGRRLENLCYAVVWTGALALLLVPDAAPQLIIAFCLAIAPSRFLGAAQRLPGYRTAWRLITFAFVALSLCDWYGEGRSLRQTVVAQMCFFQAYKAYNFKLRSDYLEMALFATLMVVLGGVASESVFFLLILLPFVALVAAFLATLNLSRQYLCPGRAKRRAADQPAAAALVYQVDPGQLQARSLALPRFSWIAQTGAVLLIGAGLFYVLPRDHALPQQYLPSMISVGGHDPVLSGLNSGVSLRHLSSIKNDPEQVLKVTFPDQPPSPEHFYLRASSLERLEELAWTPFHPGPRVIKTDNAGTYWFQQVDPADQAHLLAHRVEYLKQPGTPIALPGLVALDEVEARATSSSIAVVGHLTTLKRYRAFSWNGDAPRKTPPPRESDLVCSMSLRLPPELGTREIHTLAGEITYGRYDVADQARAIEQFLRRRYRYTLNIEPLNGPAGGPTPIERFLFERREGNCEVFASAMAVLCRCLGIPARLAIGYHGGIPGDSPREFIFRNMDAHAWVEVWSPETGWLTFDPTPAPPLEVYRGRFSFKELMEWFNRVSLRWKQLVVGYDRDAKEAWMAWLWDPLASWLLEGQSQEGAFDRLVRRAGENVRRPELATLLILLVALNALAAVLYFSLRRRWHARQRRGRRGAAGGRSDPWRRFYRSTVAVLHGQLRKRKPTQTPSEFLEALARAGRCDPPRVRAVIEFYHRGRFGHLHWDAQTAREAASLLHALEEPAGDR